MKKKKILVYGDIILDIFTYGKFIKMSPEAPVPAIKTKYKSIFNLGGAANVCSNINSLGYESSLMSFVGNDENSLKIENLLKNKNIFNLSVREKNFDITVKERIFNNFKPVIRLDNDTEFNLKKIHLKKIKHKIKKNIKKFNLIIVSDYGKGACNPEVIKYLIKEANKIQIPVFVDPNPKMKNLKMYNNIFCLKPNFNEAKLFDKKLKDNFRSIVQTSKKISKKINVKNIIVTRGKKGALLFEANNKHKNFKVKAKKIFDVTGAGDTFISSLAVNFLKTNKIISACKFANTAASISVGYLGTYAVKKGQINFSDFE